MTIYIDRTGGSAWLARQPWHEPSGPEGARAQLTVVATGMMAVASTVFAITIAAVAYASGNYGPRLLNNFMNDRGNQVSLGVFIATFVYNLTILRVVRSPDIGTAEAPAFVPHVSMLGSALSVLLSVGVLIYFLHHVPASIRINIVLGGIGERLLREIRTRFPDARSHEEPRRDAGGREVLAGDSGYVEVISFKKLDEIARREDLVIGLRVRTGDFVHRTVPIVAVRRELTGEVEERIRACFALGRSRTPTQDLEFLFDELAEIALRALSPGVNDPFTAITSLHWMGAAMAELGGRDLTAGPEQSDYDPRRVRPLPDDFRHYLRRSFGSVRRSAAREPVAAKVFLETLAGVAAAANSRARREALLEEARTLVLEAEAMARGPAVTEIRDCLAAVEDRFSDHDCPPMT